MKAMKTRFRSPMVGLLLAVFVSGGALAFRTVPAVAAAGSGLKSALR